MGFRYWKGSHTKHRLMYHVVWIPKYRKRVLRGKIKKQIIELIYEAVKINRWWVEEISIQKDHVHVMIQIHPDEKLSGVVKILKGGTSRMVRKEYPELEEFMWGNSLWARGYFAETTGRVDMRKVKKYIQEQNESMPQAD